MGPVRARVMGSYDGCKMTSADDPISKTIASNATPNTVHPSIVVEAIRNVLFDSKRLASVVH
jgi:hypothetical protein